MSQNPAKPAWPSESRVFHTLNPQMAELEAAEIARVGAGSFVRPTAAEMTSARRRSRNRVMAGAKVSTLGASTVPVETAEVLRPAAEVFGVVAKEHGHYYGERKQRTDPTTGRRVFVPPEVSVSTPRERLRCLTSAGDPRSGRDRQTTAATFPACARALSLSPTLSHTLRHSPALAHTLPQPR